MVYAIDMDGLALAWARGFSPTPLKDEQQLYAEYRKFLSPDTDTLFEKGFPGHNLQFVPAPSRFNVRMQRQQGALLYDTLQYPLLGVDNLDELLKRWNEPPIYPSRLQDEPNTLCYKIRLDQRLAQSVFQRLELMGVTGVVPSTRGPTASPSTLLTPISTTRVPAICATFDFRHMTIQKCRSNMSFERDAPKAARPSTLRSQTGADGTEVPVIFDSQDMIAKTAHHLHPCDYKAAAIYTRSAFEKLIRKHCEDRSKKLVFRSHVGKIMPAIHGSLLQTA